MTTHVYFGPKGVNAFGKTNTSRIPYYDFDIVNDIVYAARSTFGFSIIDIANKSNMVQLGEARTFPGFGSWQYRNVLFLNGFLYACVRFGHSVEVDGGGAIEKWDVTTDPANPVFINEFRWSNDGGMPADKFSRFSAFTTDGTFLYVAGQIGGAYKFDPNDLESGPIAFNETGQWETQGVAYHNGFVFFANYTFGLRIVDAETMGQVVDITIPTFNSNGDLLRPWECVVKDDWLFVSVNINQTLFPNSPNRGLLTLFIGGDISEITDWTAFSGYPANANDIWNGVGDSPMLGLSVLGNIVYVTNGQQGIMRWDVSNQNDPIYLGQQTSKLATDNLFAVQVFNNPDNNIYAIYGDGQQDLLVGSRNVYLDQVSVESGMENFAIGVDATTSSSVTGAFPSQTIALAAGPDGFHTALSNQVIDEYNIRVRDSAGVRGFDIALYDIAGGLPGNIIPGTTKTIDNPNTTNTEWRVLTTGKFPLIELDPGIIYTVAVVQSSVGANSVVAVETGSLGSRDNTVTGGTFNSSWTDSQNGGDVVVGALGHTLPKEGPISIFNTIGASIASSLSNSIGASIN